MLDDLYTPSDFLTNAKFYSFNGIQTSPNQDFITRNTDGQAGIITGENSPTNDGLSEDLLDSLKAVMGGKTGGDAGIEPKNPTHTASWLEKLTQSTEKIFSTFQKISPPVSFEVPTNQDSEKDSPIGNTQPPSPLPPKKDTKDNYTLYGAIGIGVFVVVLLLFLTKPAPVSTPLTLKK